MIHDPLPRSVPQVYKFVGVNVSHIEFITRYSRLAPQHLRANGAEAARDAGDDASRGRACEALATHLLVSDADPKGSEARSKFEMGKTKIFIRWAGLFGGGTLDGP